jgi:hypothetical protein
MDNTGFLENYKYVFDPDRLYGCSQIAPYANPLWYKGIVRKYYSEYTDSDTVKRIHRLKTEGCGYSALINTVFIRFYREKDRFEKLFGYPMFRSDGMLNFDELLVDYYFAMDNHNGFLWFDRFNPKEDDKYVSGKGTSVFSRDWRFETYMKKHGVSVDVKPIKASPEKLPEILEKGPVIVSINPTVLYDKNGEKMFEGKGGHCISVTGVSDNNLIRVSSWGREYYIKHGSYSIFESYQQVIYNN